MNIDEAYARLLALPSQLGWVDEPDETYRAAPGLNYSCLKVLCKRTPAHFLHALSHFKPPTPAMKWGTTVHKHLLEGTELAVMPEFKGTGSKAAKEEWLKEVPEGFLVVDEDEAHILACMREKMASHPLVRGALECGLIEQSGYVKTEYFAAKIRPDILIPSEGVIYDLKTCAEADEEPFARDVVNLGYHIQAAWYLTIANLVSGGGFHSFRWIALEKEPPYEVAVYEASADSLALGEGLISLAIDKLESCLKTGEWPGLGGEVKTLSLPKWAQKQAEALGGAQ